MSVITRYPFWVCPNCGEMLEREDSVCDVCRVAAVLVFCVTDTAYRGAVEEAWADCARHLRNMAADPSWKPEVQRAFEYAASTFHPGGQ